MSGSPTSKPRIIVGISGASGIVYGIEALKTLRKLDIETHLVVSKSAKVTLSQESRSPSMNFLNWQIIIMPTQTSVRVFPAAVIKTLGMLVAPCSIKTLSESRHRSDLFTVKSSC